MGQSMPPDCRTIEAELKRLPGIQAVRVAMGAGSQVAEVHVVADLAKSAKQVVRDVQSLALAKLGVEIDYRVVSVVSVEGVSVSHPKFSMQSLAVQAEADRTKCTVTLASGAQQVTASSDGGVSADSRLHSAARATLDAAARLVGGESLFTLLGVRVMDLAATEAVTAAILVARDGADDVLMGIARVDAADVCAGAVSAVIDALNKLGASPGIARD